MPTKGQYTDADLAQGQGSTPNTGAQVVDPSFGEMVGTTARAGGQFLSNAAQGIGAGALQTANRIGSAMLPDPLVRKLGMTPPTEEQTKPLFAANNPTQRVFKGAEQAGEFVIPGEAEERAIAAAPEFLRPAAKIAASALSSGAVNKAQGGSFGAGSLAGGLGAGAGMGMRAIAPSLAESALGISKADRAFSKTPGRAILDETRGVRPSTIAESGQNRLNELTPQLEQAANAASVRPAPRIKGFLPPPTDRIDLATLPGRNPAQSPIAFPADVSRVAVTSRGVKPIEFTSGGAHPELSGRIEQPQGTMTRTPEMSASIPPETERNPAATIAPARNIVHGAMGTAARQNAESLHGQLGQMNDFLGKRFNTGEPIPENVTPSQLLDLKRGFSKEFLGRWNPETHGDTIATGRKAYGALDSELDRTVPEAAQLNQRISSLIPVVHRAESVSRNPSFLQRTGARIGARTGALTMGGLGGIEGYRAGGLPGAVAGGVAGILGPELAADPEAQMIIAKALNKANTLRPAVGAGLQLTRGNQ